MDQQAPIVLRPEVVGTYGLQNFPAGMVRHSFSDLKPWPAPEWTWWLCHESFYGGWLTNFAAPLRVGLLICSVGEHLSMTGVGCN